MLPECSLYRVLQGFNFYKLSDSLSNFVPCGSYFLHGAPLRVWKGPVISSQPRNIRTLLATTHGYQQTCVAGQFFREELRLSIRQVDAYFPHRL